jgi:two-component system KDP operon response regulator KdpE
MLISSHNPDLLLLDLGLPDADGIDLIRQLRDWTSVPIIVISARDIEGDKVTALDAGADDYMTKPFGVNELLARMRAALRYGQGGTSELRQIYEFDQLRIDLVRREVTQSGKMIRLTPIEYKLLTLLVRHAGKVLTYNQILESVWGHKHENMAHHVRVHLAELRKKIEIDPARPKLIVTEPGVGYRLRDCNLMESSPNEPPRQV